MPCLANPQTGEGAWAALLEPLRADPSRAAILTDIDGTLAPIVERPEEAAVPAAAREVLATAERALRPGRLRLRPAGRGGAAAGRRSTGSPTPATTGWSCCCRATRRRGPTPRWPGASGTPPSSSPRSTPRRWRRSGLRLEDKGPIQALHWRGAEDEAAAEARAHEIAAEAGRGRARTALGAQGAGAAPGRRRRQGRRGRRAARHRRRRPRPSTPATTAPTSTPSAACASCARRAS